MTDLIACLGSGKGSWNHVKRLVEEGNWENIYLITNEFGIKNFESNEKINFIVTNFEKSAKDIIKDIKNQLEGKIRDLEVALNLVSGTGKEHMAILSALLQLGLGVRLMAVTKDGIGEI